MTTLNDIFASDMLPAPSLAARLATADDDTAVDAAITAHHNKARRLLDYSTSMVGGGEAFNRSLATDMLVQMEVLATATVDAYNRLCSNDPRSDLAQRLMKISQSITQMETAAVGQLRAPLELHYDIYNRPHETLGGMAHGQDKLPMQESDPRA